jgi:hypothetical protein
VTTAAASIAGVGSADEGQFRFPCLKRIFDRQMMGVANFVTESFKRPGAGHEAGVHVAIRRVARRAEVTDGQTDKQSRTGEGRNGFRNFFAYVILTRIKKWAA